MLTTFATRDIAFHCRPVVEVGSVKRLSRLLIAMVASYKSDDVGVS